jgi:GT2 family glycosyltransferase
MMADEPCIAEVPAEVSMSAGPLVVLMCSYNRRAHTLAALEALFSQATAEQLQVFLLDDASSDGTAEAVRSRFPQVHVIAGTGALYWNGGMRKAWQQALAQQPSAPAFIWMNDDVLLDHDALARLLKAWHQAESISTQPVGAVVGAMRQPGSQLLSYGGRRRRSRWRPLQLGPLLPESAALQHCDFINGNWCLIPAAVVSRIGILSPHFSHSMGDYDYGLRAQQAGFSLWQAPGSFGECAVNSGKGGVLDAALPMSQRLQLLTQPNRWPPADEWQYFVRCHGGPFHVLGQIRVLVRKYCPRLFLWLRQQHFPVHNGSRNAD